MALKDGMNNRVIEGRFKGAELKINNSNGKLSFDGCLICSENIKEFNCLETINVFGMTVVVTQIKWRDGTESKCWLSRYAANEIIAELKGTRKYKPPSPEENCDMFLKNIGQLAKSVNDLTDIFGFFRILK